MSPASKKAAFLEILVEGHPQLCHGLLTGLMIGSGESGARLWFSHECGVKTPLGERILNLAHLHAGVTHVLADAAGRKLIGKYAKPLEAHGVRLLQERRITGGTFYYSYHAYAPQYGDEIKKLLKELPAALEHDAGKPKEMKRKGAEAAEGYTPLHHYEIAGKGTVSGARLDLLIETRRKFEAHPLMHPDLIELSFD